MVPERPLATRLAPGTYFPPTVAGRGTSSAVGMPSHPFASAAFAARPRLRPFPAPGHARREAPQIFSTWENSSSTGVARPKIETATFRRARSWSTSSTTPLNEVKGPSATRTCSPIS